MPWFKIDDGFHGHPKVVDLSLAAVGLWTICGTWCAQYLTDGKLTEKSVFRLGGSKALSDELVEAGLWIGNDDGFEFKDWSDYQPMRAVVMAEREAARERMANIRARRTRKTGEPPIDVQPNTPRTSSEVPSPRPSPAQPVPVPKGTVKDSVSEAKAPDDAKKEYPPDVHDLCKRLADWVERNGSKRPTVTSTWLRACDLMIRIDERTPEQIGMAIDWCQRDEFWRANIMSMPKLREKYDQLRQQAQRERDPAKPKPSTTDQRVAAGLALRDQYRDMEERLERKGIKE